MGFLIRLILTSIVSFIAMMSGMGSGNIIPGVIIGFGAWGLFIWWVASKDGKKRKQREREQLLEEYLRRQLRK